MKKKITVIGAGSVGATIAYTLAVQGIANEIVMIDVNESKVLGEALDIRQGAAFLPSVSVYAGSYADAADSNIVVITSGIARKPGQTRLELTQTNVNILKSITPQIVKYAPHAIYVIVSNPVDILTYVFTKISGIPESHIMGSGTTLDTARLRARVAEYYDVEAKDINAYVLGEHGDSSFIPWSMLCLTTTGEMQYKQNCEQSGIILPEINKPEILEYMKTSGGRVIKRKGATFYAISISVAHICKRILSNEECILTVSTMMHGEHGVDDVALSYLTVVDGNGVRGKLATKLTAEEEEQLRHSAECLKNVIKDIDI
ncbi:MAG: L-lactate dehydrogenase [Acutalibacteraceae bacterium]